MLRAALIALVFLFVVLGFAGVALMGVAGIPFFVLGLVLAIIGVVTGIFARNHAPVDTNTP